ncbi:hypothetical protein I3843_12G019900 [Carya illinoinensis]|uniref:Uncharacterized protein n=1 Tax=Carya illinoinensis TaxID=32201 RepID=A0A8T1NTR4_CARIL|nr:uncharacterized protein LOC122290085 isoform X2 [Carya illinoinensis]KAG2675726.1 hypothetical protein I3760_12G019100 [Carya illinoinensis]KAG2675727.1 hypothetical protein I3760_12G019100 [Carya illinoinensis]KAG6633041.1 hypothetical protein CIPAW_12G020800 [Carya illinoinensis]KAG6683545.1 hypothetical protein I3842_12G018900 [Carya illinoinensis]KAG6683546.1 hypothetical protein I3842_12G018900 [Carya illinoinensis]
MGAISLYRGNLHRVPDVPREWRMPTPKISLGVFKSLLQRRSKALSRLCSSTTTANPNPNPISEQKQQSECLKENESSIEPKLEAKNPGYCGEGPSGEEKDQKDQKESYGGGDFPVKVDAADSLPEKGSGAVAGGANEKALPVQTKPADLATPNLEVTNKVDLLNGREKRKREVEDKLQSLNAKKHNLVQALKQILSAEEELKRRNSMQGMTTRPSVPLQVDAANDTGSLTRQPTPRTGSETNLGGDMEGGEADDPLNHSTNPRHTFRMSSMSPSSESPLRRPASNQLNMLLVVPPLLEMLGCQVHGIRRHPINILHVTSSSVFSSHRGTKSSDRAVLPR